MNTRERQTGLTMISWIVLILMIGFVGLFGFKLVPIYMDYQTINAALTNVSKNAVEAGSTVTASSLHYAIEKQFNVNDVSVISANDVKIGTDENSSNLALTLDYDARTDFVGNVSLVAHFHKVYQVVTH